MKKFKRSDVARAFRDASWELGYKLFFWTTSTKRWTRKRYWLTCGLLIRTR